MTSKRIRKIARIVKESTGTDISINLVQAVLTATEKERLQRVMRMSKLDAKIGKMRKRR